MIPALKAAIAHYGGDPAWATVRPPLVDLTREPAARCSPSSTVAASPCPGCAAERRPRMAVAGIVHTGLSVSDRLITLELVQPAPRA